MDCGFAVDVTRTLDEAAATLNCACYDILLLQLALPDGDGLDWLKQLGRSGKSMPAMVISGLNGSRSPDCKLQWWAGRFPAKAPVYR